MSPFLKLDDELFSFLFVEPVFQGRSGNLKAYEKLSLFS